MAIKIDPILLSGDEDAIHEFSGNNKQCVIVDWRGDEEEIINEVADTIPKGLSYVWSESGDDIVLLYKGRIQPIGLTHSERDRYIAIRAINLILKGHYELRLFRVTSGSDTHTFYVKAAKWWREAEIAHPAAIASVFRVVDESSDFDEGSDCPSDKSDDTESMSTAMGDHPFPVSEDQSYPMVSLGGPAMYEDPFKPTMIHRDLGTYSMAKSLTDPMSQSQLGSDTTMRQPVFDNHEWVNNYDLMVHKSEIMEHNHVFINDVRANFYESAALIRIFLDDPVRPSDIRLLEYFRKRDIRNVNYTTKLSFSIALTKLADYARCDMYGLSPEKYLSAISRMKGWYRVIAQRTLSGELSLASDDSLIYRRAKAMMGGLTTDCAMEVESALVLGMHYYPRSRIMYVSTNKPLDTLGRQRGMKVWAVLDEPEPVWT